LTPRTCHRLPFARAYCVRNVRLACGDSRRRSRATFMCQAVTHLRIESMQAADLFRRRAGNQPAKSREQLMLRVPGSGAGHQAGRQASNRTSVSNSR
jgi:hypothetical protein